MSSNAVLIGLFYNSKKFRNEKVGMVSTFSKRIIRREFSNHFKSEGHMQLKRGTSERLE